MKPSLQPGLTSVKRIPIDRDRTISFMGEDARVYATPRLISDIEFTCRDLILQHADPGEDSVGTEVCVKHLAATLAGSMVEISVRITAVDGRKIDRSAEVPPLVASVKPGSKSSLEVWRDGSKRTLAVTVGELKADQVASAKPASRGGEDTGKLGLAVRPLEDASGLVVENASGPAARAGIRRGDVVVLVNGKPVKTANDLQSAAAKAKGTLAVLVKRGDQSIFVPIEIG